MAVAWRYAGYSLATWDRLFDWTLKRACVQSTAAELHIRVEPWRAALPALKAAFAKRQQRDGGMEGRQLLLQLVDEEQPTEWVDVPYSWSFKRDAAVTMTEVEVVHSREDSVYVVRDADGWLRDVSDMRRRSADYVQRVEREEVLRDISWNDLSAGAVQRRDVEVHCRLVLQACPYLQHLGLLINVIRAVEPSHEDTFALVPRLRSLLLNQYETVDELELVVDTPPVDFERMLDSLPRLTALTCRHVYISISDLLDIASHSTLEQLHIEASGRQVADAEWLGTELRFPIDELEDDMQLAQAAAGVMVDGDVEEAEEETEAANDEHCHQAVGSSREAAPAWTQDDMQRMRVALCRTQPTRRSCETRLALADWLHKRLRRGGLRTDGDQPTWLLAHYRRQLAVLRSTLRGHLSQLQPLPSILSDASTSLSVENVFVGDSHKRLWAEVGERERAERLQQLCERLRLRNREWRKAEHQEHVSRVEMRHVQRQLAAPLDQVTATQRSMAAFRLVRLGRDAEAQREKAAELNRQVRWLTDQVRSLQLALQAILKDGELKYAVVLASVTKSHDLFWMCLWPTSR